MYAIAMKQDLQNEETTSWKFVAFFEDATIAKASFLQSQLQLIEKGGTYQSEIPGSADQCNDDLNLDIVAKAVMSVKVIGNEKGHLAMALIELQTISKIRL